MIYEWENKVIPEQWMNGWINKQINAWMNEKIS